MESYRCIFNVMLLLFVINLQKSECAQCQPGTYSDTGSSSCFNCPIGKYQNLPGQSSCTNCPVGTFQNEEGAGICKICEVGDGVFDPTVVLYTNSNSCIQIPCDTRKWTSEYLCECDNNGYYQSQMTGYIGCAECEAGKYSNSYDSLSCELCTPGKYQPIAQQSSCRQCEPGKFSVNYGSTSCILCPAGRYAENEGRSICDLCDYGYYQSTPGQTHCNSCPDDKTSSPGASECSPFSPVTVWTGTGCSGMSYILPNMPSTYCFPYINYASQNTIYAKFISTGDCSINVETYSDSDCTVLVNHCAEFLTGGIDDVCYDRGFFSFKVVRCVASPSIPTCAGPTEIKQKVNCNTENNIGVLEIGSCVYISPEQGIRFDPFNTCGVNLLLFNTSGCTGPSICAWSSEGGSCNSNVHLPLSAPYNYQNFQISCGNVSAGGSSCRALGSSASSKGDCFPGSSVVERDDGVFLTMKDLRVGMRVRVFYKEDIGGSVLISDISNSTFNSMKKHYSDVFFFSHQDEDAESVYLNLEFTDPSNQKTTLKTSPNHLIYINNAFMKAELASLGDISSNADGDILILTGKSITTQRGLFNPHTMAGELIVDGVRVSCYTDTIESTLAHAMLAPLRAVYGVGAVL